MQTSDVAVERALSPASMAASAAPEGRGVRLPAANAAQAYRLVIATDAWRPQVNGVVRSLENMLDHAAACGFAVQIIAPNQFRSAPMPGYPEIRLAMPGRRALANLFTAWQPHYVHIATEGPIGWATRALCLAHQRPFTTSYHTRFPEYLAARLPVPQALSYAVLRRFHNAGAGVMVSTASLADELGERGFQRVLRWSRGVDGAVFQPHPHGRAAARALAGVAHLPQPLLLYVGRVAVEKNLPAFLSLDTPGTKIIVGDGPARAALQQAYPQAVFTGVRFGADLAAIYAACDVLVFPSLTDTFGIVVLEALASGLPVAAYPAPGPRDVLEGSAAGALDHDLAAAIRRALQIDPAHCRTHGACFTWRASAGQFFNNIIEAHALAESEAQRLSDAN